MANWCDTSIAFYSRDRVNLTALRNKIAEITNDDSWLGNVLIHYGFNPKDFNCRSSIYYISDVSQDEDKIWYFLLDQADAWSPHTDAWDYILSSVDGDIEYVYKSEEPGQGVFVNSDTEGWYFKERYVIDASILDTEDKIYTQTESETISLCRFILNDRSIRTISQAKSLASIILESGKGEWFNVWKFEEA